MNSRVYCFNPGPATLPLPVLQEVRDELLDYRGTGMSVMELSHRSAEYGEIHADARRRFKELLGLGEEWRILFLTGGSSTQFYALPMNLLRGGRADYICTGAWFRKAVTEARRFGEVHIAYDAAAEDGRYYHVPRQEQLDLSPDARYVYFTSNNTIAGTQFHTFPEPPPGVFLAADMCSDLLWRRFDPAPFGIFFTSAQKNLGPAGVTLVAIRNELLDRCAEDLPTMVSYRRQAEKDSLFNTPPCFAVYVMGKVLAWLQELGGLEEIERRNRAKAALLYEALDARPDLWITRVQPESRSVMNVVWRIRDDEELERRFVAEAAEHGMVGLKGHRSVGGIRASIYNAMPLAGVQRLVDFMDDFARRHA